MPIESAPQRRYYPVFLDAEGRRCVVVGGGNVAVRKAHALVVAGAEVTVVAPEVCFEMEALAAASPRVHVVRRRFEQNDLRGAFLAIAATDDAAVNEAVGRAARERSIPVNVADDPALSSFIVPATLTRGRLQVAISTAGASPAFAARLRKRLDEQLDPRLAAYVEAMADARAVVLAEVADLARRTEIFEHLTSDAVVEQYLQEPPEQGDAWLMGEARRLIAGAGERA